MEYSDLSSLDKCAERRLLRATLLRRLTGQGSCSTKMTSFVRSVATNLMPTDLYTTSKAANQSRRMWQKYEKSEFGLCLKSEGGLLYEAPVREYKTPQST